MQFITDLSEKQRRDLTCSLQLHIANNTELVCYLADQYDVDRNDVLGLYVYLQKKYCDKQDFNKKDLKFLKRAEKIAKKIINRGA